MGRRAILLAVYLLVAIGTPMGHGLVVGLHVLHDHTGVPTPGAWLNSRFETMLDVTRLEWSLELGFDVDAEGQHSHGAGDTHAHDAGSGSAHSHIGSRASVDAPEQRGEMPTETESGDHLAGGAVPMTGEHAHDGYVHSHDTDPTQDLAHLTANLSKHFLPAPSTAISPAITADAAPWLYGAGASETYSAVLLPPPRFL